MNSIFLETYTTPKDFKETAVLKLPLESFIILCVYKGCAPVMVNLNFVTVTEKEEKALDLRVPGEILFVNKNDLPWTVTLCNFPVVLVDDTIITGLCAVARHICKYRTSKSCAQEHEEGLLGFRKSCLQAPNEVSIWTKFCEVDLLKTVKCLLCTSEIEELPTNLIRFQNHLSKPVRIHNVYKVARQIKKDSLEDNKDYTEVKNSQTNNTSGNRISKHRRWKSNKNKELETDCSIKIEDLHITHQFAEGPFLTLADIILLALHHIVKLRMGDCFESLLPTTNNWYRATLNILELKPIQIIFSNVILNPMSIASLTVPDAEDVSLYKCDPKRHNPKKRLFTKEGDIEDALSVVTGNMELEIKKNDMDFSVIKWSEIPDGADPNAGHLPDKRKDRKAQQLENLALAVTSIAKSGDVIVDFCCGSGHLGILLAHLLPECTILLLENKEQSLIRARTRVHDMGLTNVYFYQCNLDFFIGKFDIGVALHACGVASDLVLDKCLKSNAKFVLCPCCYGSLHVTDRLVYPRSGMFGKMSVEQYMCIGHVADQTHEQHPLTVRGARCMAIIDSDRAHLAEELGYTVTLSRLSPLSCTPKNNLLIGVPS